MIYIRLRSPRNGALNGSPRLIGCDTTLIEESDTNHPKGFKMIVLPNKDKED